MKLRLNIVMNRVSTDLENLKSQGISEKPLQVMEIDSSRGTITKMSITIDQSLKYRFFGCCYSGLPEKA